MSRTYRCRRLPKLGSARKLLDGNAGGIANRVLADLENNFVSVIGPLDWNLRWNILRAMEQQVILPAASKGWHPWLAVEVYFAKKPYRVPGNRRVRRLAKKAVRNWAHLGDDFEGVLPGKLDGWNAWDLS